MPFFVAVNFLAESFHVWYHRKHRIVTGKYALRLMHHLRSVIVEALLATLGGLVGSWSSLATCGCIIYSTASLIPRYLLGIAGVVLVLLVAPVLVYGVYWIAKLIPNRNPKTNTNNNSRCIANFREEWEEGEWTQWTQW